MCMFIVPLLVTLFVRRRHARNGPFIDLGPLFLRGSVVKCNFVMLTVFLATADSLMAGCVGDVVQMSDVRTGSLDL